MEALYFIDRTLTRGIQMVTEFLSRRFEINLRNRSVLTILLGLLVWGTVLWTFDIDYLGENGGLSSIIWYQLFAFVLYLSIPVLGLTIERYLKKLHCFFDYERANSSDKLYEDGYSAWSFVCLVIGYVLLTRSTLGPLAEASFLMVFIVMFNDVIVEFTSRKRGNPRNKRVVTESLKSLLEKCGWIKQPNKVPTT